MVSVGKCILGVSVISVLVEPGFRGCLMRKVSSQPYCNAFPRKVCGYSFLSDLNIYVGKVNTR